MSIESESVRTSRRKCVPSDRFSYPSPLTLCPSADLTACYRPARRSNTTCNGERDDEDDELDGMVGLFPELSSFFLIWLINVEEDSDDDALVPRQGGAHAGGSGCGGGGPPP